MREREKSVGEKGRMGRSCKKGSGRAIKQVLNINPEIGGKFRGERGGGI